MRFRTLAIIAPVVLFSFGVVASRAAAAGCESLTSADARSLCYYNLGLDEYRSRHYDQAVADYTRALQINPNYAGAYYGRGVAYRHLAKYPEAIADYTHALQINPKFAYAYYSRATVYYILLDWAHAISDDDSALKILGWKDKYSPYSAIREYLVYRIRHDTSKASALLSKCLTRCSNAWPYPLLQYFQKAISRNRLLSLAGADVGKLTEVYTYLGMEALAAGKNSVARTDLAWVLKNGDRAYTEYDLAKALMLRLAPSASPADWRPAAMREFFTWALDVAYKMSAQSAYTGPNHTPDDLRRLIGGCDPQARDNPTLSLDLLCGNAPDRVFADRADFLAIANGSLPSGFAKADCPAASTLPDYLKGTVLLECFRNSSGSEIDLEYNTDPRIKGRFGISIVELPHS